MLLLSNLGTDQADDEGLGKGLIEICEEGCSALHMDSDDNVIENSDTPEDRRAHG